MTTEKPFRSRIAGLGPVRLLAALVAVDLVLVGISLTRSLVVGDSLDDPWLLETDRGWSEFVGYAHQGTAAVLLLALAYVSRHALWAAFAAILLCALADDFLRLHENYGGWLADRLEVRLGFPESVAGLRTSDLGEMAVWGVLAVVPVLAALLLYSRSDAPNRRAGRVMAGLLAAYVFFGAVVDQLHVLFLDSWVGDLVGAMEDGGELVVLSLCVVYALGLLAAARGGTPGGPEATAPAREVAAVV
jgi:hypothetical protein